MTNTTYVASVSASGADEAPKRAGGLSTMKLAELQGLAGGLGLTGTAKMRKGDLVIAIKAHQSGGSVAGRPRPPSVDAAVAASVSGPPANQRRPAAPSVQLAPPAEHSDQSGALRPMTAPPAER